MTSSVARVVAKLEGKEDPGAPQRADAVRTRTYKTKAETEAKKPVTATIVLTLLFISVVVPMLQYWGYTNKVGGRGWGPLPIRGGGPAGLAALAAGSWGLGCAALRARACRPPAAGRLALLPPMLLPLPPSQPLPPMLLPLRLPSRRCWRRRPPAPACSPAQD